jgi:23S rRNA (adenine2503-C2)-methyltransferase
MTSLPLVFDPPKAALPPRHLADLSPTERRAAVVELGEQPFRADQLSRHYFHRLTNRPEQLTDLPAGSRDRLWGELFPELLTEVRHVETDRGTTRKTLWKLHDGTLVESVLMRYRDRAHGVHLQPGRLRDGLPVLRHRPGRPQTQSVHR